MSSAGEAAPSKNKGEKTIWKVSATIANKRAVRMRGPGEIVMVSGFIPPAAPINIIAHAQASRMPKRVGTPHQVDWKECPANIEKRAARSTGYGRHRSFRMGDKPEITQQKSACGE